MDTMPHYDLAVIGGGINGVGIAADAAGRGLTVVLVEAEDLASATSSASSKLLHGGLRYLEQLEFRLVHEALSEREVLLRVAPHITRPLRFRLPLRAGLRPAWLLRLGLVLYDHMARRTTLPPSTAIRFQAEDGLQPDLLRGFEYSDVWVDDARLVVLNAMRAADRGALILPRTRCVRARRQDGFWQLRLEDALSGEEFTLLASGLVNAAGPWVKRLFEEQLQFPSPHGIRLVKGSHIVVPRLHERDEAYILQNTDGRVVFIIPYLQQYSLIGTTDLEYRGDMRHITISEPEVHYLCEVVNTFFRRQIHPQDVRWSYAGVRPLCDDESARPQAISRDYTLSLDDKVSQLPLLSVFGGKLTTYRKLAEAACLRLRPYYPQMGSSWTATTPLPGGDFAGSVVTLAAEYAQSAAWLTPVQAERLARAYGTLARDWLPATPGEQFGGGLTSQEVDYLIQREWAMSVEDILWRRSKLGLFLDAKQQSRLADYVSRRLPDLLPERLGRSRRFGS